MSPTWPVRIVPPALGVTPVDCGAATLVTVAAAALPGVGAGGTEVDGAGLLGVAGLHAATTTPPRPSASSRSVDRRLTNSSISVLLLRDQADLQDQCPGRTAGAGRLARAGAAHRR